MVTVKVIGFKIKKIIGGWENRIILLSIFDCLIGLTQWIK